MLFKSMLKKIWNSPISILVRNELRIRPVRHYFLEKKNLSYSDLHYWVASDDYSTKYIFNDTLREFANINDGKYSLVFLDSDGNEILERQISPKNGQCEFFIEKGTISHEKNYGTFFVKVLSDTACQKDLSVSFKNRWYTGYSYRGCIHSMVHGNTLVTWNSLDGKNEGFGITQSTIFRKYKYFLQVDPENYDEVKLVLVNPCKKEIKISIGETSITVPSKGVRTYKTKSNEKICLTSNCSFLRPIVIGSKNGYIDCFHG